MTQRTRQWIGSLLLVSGAASAQTPRGTEDFVNPEPTVVAQCYTRTAGVANPCWACHTSKNGLNHKADWILQQSYAFSPVANRNHWDNLFEDRRADAARIGDDEVLAHIRSDNLGALLRAAKPAAGYAPDLDLTPGFDADGFARDGSGWRALRYQPFPGVFWPTNGATDDVFLRLPAMFSQDAQGRPSRTIARVNHAILERAMTVPDTRSVELPSHYAGAAATIPVHRWRYPLGTEFLHGVRYVDPDAPDLRSLRLKELRYSRKTQDPDETRIAIAYQREFEEKTLGWVPAFHGDAQRGLGNAYGWTYQGWIEDAQGALRPQTREETTFCMGCHGGIGITVDSSFAFPRKLPGAAGWALQTLRGQHDRPQAGHTRGEVLTWLQRAQGGDEFRSNTELLARFFPGGRLDAAAVTRAAPGGDRDLHWLLAPSRERALALNKSYWALVRAQDFVRGRDVVLAPPRNVHREIRNGDTGLSARGRVYSDGRLWLEGSAPGQSPPSPAD